MAAGLVGNRSLKLAPVTTTLVTFLSVMVSDELTLAPTVLGVKPLPISGEATFKSACAALALLPPVGGLTREAALALVHKLKAWPLLDGYRGRPKADVAALADAIVAFAGMADELGNRLVEAEINPLFVLPAGQGVRAADGVAVLGAGA